MTETIFWVCVFFLFFFFIERAGFMTFTVDSHQGVKWFGFTFHDLCDRLVTDKAKPCSTRSQKYLCYFFNCCWSTIMVFLVVMLVDHQCWSFTTHGFQCRCHKKWEFRAPRIQLVQLFISLLITSCSTVHFINPEENFSMSVYQRNINIIMVFHWFIYLFCSMAVKICIFILW